MISILTTPKNALLTLSRNPLLLLASIATDVIALFTFGYLSTPVYDKLTEHAIILGTLISQPTARGTAILTTLTSATAIPYTTNLLLLLSLLLAITATTFALSQTINYTIAGKMANKKFTPAPFLRAVLLWTPILAIMYALHLLIDLRHTILNKITPTPNTLGTALWIIDGILILLALATLPTGLKKGMQWIRTKPADFLATTAVTTLTFLLLNTLLTRAAHTAPELLVLAGLFLFFPVLALIRIIYTIEVSNVHQ